MSEEANENKESAPVEGTNAISEIFAKTFGDVLDRRVRERLRSVYANHVNFEITDVDLKMLFGQLNQSLGKPDIDWHTAVTVTWPQAKIISYFLRVNIAIYESTREAIKIPAGMLPPTIPLPEDADTNPVSKKVFETVQAIRQELMDEQMSFWPKAPGGE